MTVETRYFNFNRATVNGLTSFVLGLTVGLSSGCTAYKTGSYTVYWGFRVWKRSSAGVETEITSGVVTIGSRSVNGSGIQSVNWTPPQTALATTDSIVVRIYTKFGTGEWQLLIDPVYGYESVFQTEALGDTQLDAVQWTVNMFTLRDYYAGETESDIIFVYDSPYSRIDNFSHSTPVAVVPQPLGDGLAFVM